MSGAVDFAAELKSLSPQEFESFYNSQPENLQAEINGIIGLQGSSTQAPAKQITPATIDAEEAQINPEGFTPEQQKELSYLEDSGLTKFVDVMSAPQRFLTGQKKLAEQTREIMSRKNELRGQGLNSGQILMQEVQDSLKAGIKEGLHAAPMITPGGLGKIALVAALSLFGEELLEGEDISDAAMSGVIVGSSTFLGGKLLAGPATKLVKKGGSVVTGGLKKASKPFRESEIAKSATKGLTVKSQNLGRYTEKAILKLNDKILSMKNNANKVISEMTANKIATKSSNLAGAQEALDIVDGEIKNKMASFSDELLKGTKEVRGGLSAEYTELLKGKTGKKLIEVGDILDDALGKLGILASSGQTAKGKLSKFISTIMPSASGESKIALTTLLNKVKNNKISSTQLELKDVHFLKQVFNDFSNSLKATASNQQFAFSLADSAQQLVSRVDDSVGGYYGKLGKRWGKMISNENVLDSLLGKVETSVLGSQRKGVGTIFKQLERGIMAGDDILQQSFIQANDKVRGVLTEIEYLRQAGMHNMADDLTNQLKTISSSYLNKKNVLDAKKTILGLKDSMIKAGVKEEVIDGISNELNLTSGTINKIKRTRSDLEWNMILAGRELQKKVLDHSDISLIGTNIAAGQLAKALPAASGPIGAGIMLLSAKKYGGMATNTVLLGLDAIKTGMAPLIQKLSPSMRIGAQKALVTFFRMIEDETRADAQAETGQ